MPSDVRGSYIFDGLTDTNASAARRKPRGPGAGRIVELRSRCPGLARLNAIARVPCPGQQVLRR
jgi:hypothetical protein